MCLVKVRQEEDVVVPYRVVDRRRRSPSPRRRASRTSVRRYSRDEIVRETTTTTTPRQSAPYMTVPAPKPLAIPAPQPVPVFVQPPPELIPVPAPAQSHHQHRHHGAQYVEVSPRSSATSMTSSPGRSEYVYREHEVRRERAYSPERSPRYEHFRYVEPPPSEGEFYERDRYERRARSRSRQRSRSRGGDYYETNARVSYVSDDGRRRREYRD